MARFWRCAADWSWRLGDWCERRARRAARRRKHYPYDDD